MFKPTIEIWQDLETLSQKAAAYVTEWVQEDIRQTGRAHVALSGGGTPQRLYQLLAQQPLPWEKVHFWWADERCVPPDDPGSNYHLAHQALLYHLHLPAGNIHRVLGELTPAEAAAEYTEQLHQWAEDGYDWPRLTVAILGLGTDGHTASLFPGSPLTFMNPAVAVTADYDGRPAHRVTLTPPVFNSAGRVLFLATGGNKADTIWQVVYGEPRPEQLPAQRIQPKSGQVFWLVDQPAGEKVK